MKSLRNGSEPRAARDSAVAWAAVLIGGSLLLLVFNLNLLERFRPLSNYLVAGALALGGVALLASVVTRPAAWWRLIPAWTLFALAAMVLLAPTGGGRWVAALLLFGLALAFVNIFLLERTEHWWALLPAGFMTVLGLVVGLSSFVERLEILGAALFAGLGVVFLLLGLTKPPLGGPWANIPATILLLFGFFVLTLGAGEGAFWARWWPLAPLVAGVVIAWVALTRRGAPAQLEVNRAPSKASGNPTTSATTSAAPLTSADGSTMMSNPATRPAKLGEYTQPAPGASVQILSDE